MIYKAVREEIEQLLIESVGVVSGNLSGLVFNLEKPKERTHGDFSSNLAFQLSKRLNKSPLEIASQIFKNIKKSNMIERVEVARPGFINFHLKLSIKQKVIETILDNGASFGRSTIGKGEKVLLEFVSANPTGP